MTDTVVSLADARQRRSPHTYGTAICGGCKHRWDAIAPVDTVALTCPECSAQRGLWEFNYAENANEEHFTCATCRSEHFRVLRNGILCIGCCTRTTFAELC